MIGAFSRLSVTACPDVMLTTEAMAITLAATVVAKIRIHEHDMPLAKLLCSRRMTGWVCLFCGWSVYSNCYGARRQRTSGSGT